MSLSRPLFALGLAALLVAAACTDHSSKAPPPPIASLAAPTLAVEDPGNVTPAAPSPQPEIIPSSPAATAKPTEKSPAGASGTDTIAFEYLQVLVDELGARESATDQELRAADFLVEEFQSLGYTAETQPFDVEIISSETSSLTLSTAPGDPGVPEAGEVLPVIPLSGTGVGRGQGGLVNVGLAGPEDLPEPSQDSLRGEIALIQRGIITFREKVSRVAGAGAVAAVIYNDSPGIFQGTLGEEGAIPAVAISSEDGEKLLARLTQGEVEATVSVEQVNLPSRNVVAELPETGEAPREVVILGGHYDTVPGIAGANDNASGTAVLLALAKELAQRDLDLKLRFVAFGSEELGLLGSRAYLDSLSDAGKSDILAMLNFDALATGSQVTILGSDSLTSLVEKLAEDQGIAVLRRGGVRGGSSDHASFARQGIPVLMFTAPDFSRIHTPNDTMEFVDGRLMGDSIRLALALLESVEFPR